MQRKLLKQWVTDQSFWKRVRHPLARLILILGVFLASVPAANAETVATETSSDSSIASHSAAVEVTTASEAEADFPANGVYLYGRSPQPGQLDTDYAVMEVRDRKTVGAFYRVSSSFDCFHGEVGSENVNLTVISSYEQEAYNHSLPIDREETIASTDGGASGAVELVGLHSISTVSDMDMEILATCQAIHAQEI
ncbi:MAG: hypothetical protein WBA57_03295 [Elainellaceae cyanobacterium]